MKEGDILLTALPQADGTIKDRPVLFLHRMSPLEAADFRIADAEDFRKLTKVERRLVEIRPAVSGRGLFAVDGGLNDVTKAVKR